jgi:hypothetical protein
MEAIPESQIRNVLSDPLHSNLGWVRIDQTLCSSHPDTAPTSEGGMVVSPTGEPSEQAQNQNRRRAHILVEIIDLIRSPLL